MTADPTTPPWTKAIPPARDRLQSRILVWTTLPILGFLIISEVRWIVQQSDAYFWFLDGSGAAIAKTIATSVAFAYAAWRLRAATPAGAVCGGMICLLITEFSLGRPGSYIFHSGLSPLLLLFILTFAATRLGHQRKSVAGVAESRKGRTAAQVIANLGIAALFASPWSLDISSVIVILGKTDRPFAYASRGGHTILMHLLWLPILSALAEAAADTVSSEIGHAFGGQPILLATLRRVPPGTDGAITPIGTLAGIVAAAVIAFSGAPAMSMAPAECLVAFAAGVLGLFFDSLLGATLERRGWIGNDLVNFASTAFAAAASLAAVRLFGDSLAGFR